MLLTESKLYAEYERRAATSRQLASHACDVFPSGVTHDARSFEPFPIYIERAESSRKWDVDGNEYVDYFGGHGALMLGHSHPQVTAAVREQLKHGTHYGACHQLELRWAQLVRQMMPSAERVRFTGSGTEATLMALRLARAFTGKPKIIRFRTHFHGWHDHVAFGVGSHYDGSPTPGVIDQIAANVLLCDPNDIISVREHLASRPDIAAVILEPTGAAWGQIPTPGSFLHELREATADHGVQLIFDEVVTGFRCSPGGAQGVFGITPDLTTLAKILAGGYPGGAVVGRKDIMDSLDHAASTAAGREKITHQGTYNANPVSAAAGIAALEIVASTDVCGQATEYALRLQESLRRVLLDEQLDWCVYGTFSGFHIYLNPGRESVSPQDIEAGKFDWQKIKAASASPLTKKLRLGMLVHGVDVAPWPGGATSAVHTDDDLEITTRAFRQTIRILKKEGDI